MTIPPFNPQSNGLAEIGVKTIKNKLKASLGDPKNKGTNINTLIHRILLTYNTPHSTTGIEPSQRVFGRLARTRLDLLKDTHVPEMWKLQQRSKFVTGDMVIVRNYSTVLNKKWIKATVIKKMGNTIYLCKGVANNRIYKRHVKQMWSILENETEKVMTYRERWKMKVKIQI